MTDGDDAPTHNPCTTPVHNFPKRHGGRGAAATVERMARFMQLADVAEELDISPAQAYALVRAGALPAIKVGGRGQWRVERSELEAYIERAYAETRAFVDAHPLGRRDAVDDLVDEDDE